jgi:hypothetical protein
MKGGVVRDQSSIDVVVDKNVNGEEFILVILQHLQTLKIPDMISGVLIIEIDSNKRSLAIDQSAIKK